LTQEPFTELVDVYDDAGKWLGTKDRRATHREGDWHRCFHCVIVSRAEGNARLTLQRRGLGLEEYPGQIDVTVAGHLRAGERVEDAAVREISEELGAEVSFTSLERVGECPLVVRTAQLYVREATDVFLLHDDSPPSAFRFDRTEVASLVSVDLVDVCALWTGDRTEIVAQEHDYGGSVDRSVRLAGFVNDVPDYWHWLAGVLIAP
jgi:isopentenyldiphosphate isomerase